ncbi:MAG: hypothetical protein WCS72_19800, partial [Deltaproteobacteria bacterium]
MSLAAPAWALLVEAIDALGSTHLAPGVHVRALPSPRLGLPCAPLLVSRLVLDAKMVLRLARHQEIQWIDSRGNPLATPFQVTPDNPVTGHLPSPGAIWIQLMGGVKPRPGVELPDTRVPPIIRGGPLIPRPPLPSGPPRPPEDPFVLHPVIRRGDRLIGNLAEVLIDRLGWTGVGSGGLRFEQLASSGVGLGAVQGRSTAPYVLAGQHIDTVRVSGQGVVQGVRWLAREDLREQRWAFWEAWSLPLTAAEPRYTPTPAARIEAGERVRQGAPVRHPMYEAFTAPDPGSAPAATPLDAVKRVASVQGDLDRWLRLVLHDLTRETDEVTEEHAVSGANGRVVLPIEPNLIASSVDADVGRWLGLGDVDRESPREAGCLAIYLVRGAWRWRPKRIGRLLMMSLLP